MTSFDFLFERPAKKADGIAAHHQRGAEWIECPDCGQLQALPMPRAGLDRACYRCDSSFGSGVSSAEPLLAISCAMLAIFFAANLMPLLGVFVEGRHNDVTISAAANGLFKSNMYLLGSFVMALTVVLPLAHMSMQTYVLACLHRGKRPPYLARVFLWAERIRIWAMLDVFLLALFITVSKLKDMAQVQLQPGTCALATLIGLFVVFSALVDRQKIWDEIMPPQPAGKSPQEKDWIGCIACNMMHDVADSDTHCRRCDSRLHHRKPDSIARTWALVIAGYALYIPANLYPVMTFVAFGRERATTIMDGVQQLWNGKDWPYAFLIFAASIVIPLFKLVGLTGFLLTFHLRSKTYLSHCTRLYRLFDKIGRWSVLDIFVAAVLGALVDFGNVATVIPGPGLVPFACVVVLTVMAVEFFDPRLMWDAAGGNYA